MISYKSSIILILYLLLSCDRRPVPIDSCMENDVRGEEEFFVFVGEKIELKELAFGGFLCTYKILQKICGKYERDTIEFVEYDSLGIPSFTKYKNVLLYVSKYSDGHQEYFLHQYNDLYLTKDQSWASPYSPRNYDLIDSSLPRVKPVKLEFEHEVSFDISGKSKEFIIERFPEPYYRIAGNKAFAEYGNYIPELFHLKKQGVFKKRWLFGKDDEPRKITISRVEPEIMKISDSAQLIATFQQLLNGMINQDAEKIRSVSFDSVFCSFCEAFPRIRPFNTYLPIDNFISACFKNLPGNEIKKQMLLGEFDLSVNKSPKTTRNYIDVEPDGKIVVYTVEINKVQMIGVDDLYMSHDFIFLKVKGKLFFNGISSMHTSAY